MTSHSSLTSHASFRFNRRLAMLSAAAVLLVAGCGGSDGDQENAYAAPSVAMPFRIQPYLQQPGSDGMLITWFGTSAHAGRVTVTGPGLSKPLVLDSTPEPRPEMAYTQQERDQKIAGLADGSWLIAGDAYRHAVRVTGLRAGSTYQYTVQQNQDSFKRAFKTAPSASDWRQVRFVAMSDSETEPEGRVIHREWAPGPGGENRPGAGSAWAQRFGTARLGGQDVLRYALTETVGYTHNLRIVDSRQPDFIMMPGDLPQGAGYQPGWDEFFRHNAGEFGNTLSSVPLLAAYGNWETYAHVSGGYGTPEDRSPVVRSRHRFKTFISGPDNGTAAHKTNYHRIDYGPVTVITLDSTKGAPDDNRNNYPVAERLTGLQYTVPGSDTQSSFKNDEYAAAAAKLGLVNDLSPFNEGSVQWHWAARQLADARAKGQIIFVQFHHVPYSSSTHGFPMNHASSSGQGTTPMRVYHPLFEKFGVAAVIAGHNEMFERSFVDEDGDGVGVHYYDVGVAGDGLRGAMRKSNGYTEGANSNRFGYNTFSKWTADEHAPEVWQTVGGVPQLVDGGKHYGHLEVNVQRVTDGSGLARVSFTPVYSFPVMNERYELLRTERREYNDRVNLLIGQDGRVQRSS